MAENRVVLLGLFDKPKIGARTYVLADHKLTILLLIQVMVLLLGSTVWALAICSYYGFFFFFCHIMKLKIVLDLQLSEDFEEVSVQSRGFGILDVGYRSQVYAWLPWIKHNRLHEWVWGEFLMMNHLLLLKFKCSQKAPFPEDILNHQFH